MIGAPLRVGARELRYLLERGYPLEASLQLVGNRHALALLGRDLLRRGVVAAQTAAARRSKLLSPEALAGINLAVDGHNQLITLESALKGKPLVAADDGLVRDVARVGRTYRPGPVSRKALGLLLELLSAVRPASTLFLFDAPVSGSGELALLVRQALAAAGLPGEARAIPYPEAELAGYPGPVATSDGPLIDLCPQAADLAGAVIRAHFSQLLISLES